MPGLHLELLERRDTPSTANPITTLTFNIPANVASQGVYAGMYGQIQAGSGGPFMEDYLAYDPVKQAYRWAPVTDPAYNANNGSPLNPPVPLPMLTLASPGTMGTKQVQIPIPNGQEISGGEMFIFIGGPAGGVGDLNVTQNIAQGFPVVAAPKGLAGPNSPTSTINFAQFEFTLNTPGNYATNPSVEELDIDASAVDSTGYPFTLVYPTTASFPINQVGISLTQNEITQNYVTNFQNGNIYALTPQQQQLYQPFAQLFSPAFYNPNQIISPTDALDSDNTPPSTPFATPVTNGPSQLSAGTYYYLITAWSNNEIPNSNGVLGETLPSQAVAVTTAAGQNVALSWAPYNDPNTAGYNIYRYSGTPAPTSASTYSLIAHLSGIANTSYVDVGALPQPQQITPAYASDYGFNPLSQYYTPALQQFFNNYAAINSFTLGENGAVWVGNSVRFTPTDTWNRTLFTASYASGATTLTVTSAPTIIWLPFGSTTGPVTDTVLLYPGEMISGAGIQPGTTILSVVGSTVTLSSPTTAAATSAGLTAQATYTALKLTASQPNPSGTIHVGDVINIYDPIFAANTRFVTVDGQPLAADASNAPPPIPIWLNASKPGGTGANPAETPSQIVFGCSAVFATNDVDPDIKSTAPSTDEAAAGALEASLSAAFNRGVATNYAIAPDNWSAEPFITSYPTVASNAGSTLARGVYYYEVTSVDVYGESTPSLEVNATVTADNAQGVTLNWSPNDGVSGVPPLYYNVYRGTSSDNLTLYATGIQATNFTDSGIPAQLPANTILGTGTISSNGTSVTGIGTVFSRSLIGQKIGNSSTGFFTVASVSGVTNLTLSTAPDTAFNNSVFGVQTSAPVTPPFQYFAPGSYCNIYAAYVATNNVVNPVDGVSVNGLSYGFAFSDQGGQSTNADFIMAPTGGTNGVAGASGIPANIIINLGQQSTPLNFVTQYLPDAQVNQSYGQTVRAGGGASVDDQGHPDVTFSTPTSGPGVPPSWLTVAPTGLVSGTPPASTTYQVESVTITNGGSNYTSAPTVTFSSPPRGGTTATGIAVISPSSNQVVGVIITNPGKGYTSAPKVTIGGGSATATATIYAPITFLVTATARVDPDHPISQPFQLNVVPPPAIAPLTLNGVAGGASFGTFQPLTLPAADASSGYQTLLTPAGGTGPYTLAYQGGGLPPPYGSPGTWVFTPTVGGSVNTTNFVTSIAATSFQLGGQTGPFSGGTPPGFNVGLTDNGSLKVKLTGNGKGYPASSQVPLTFTLPNGFTSPTYVAPTGYATTDKMGTITGVVITSVGSGYTSQDPPVVTPASGKATFTASVATAWYTVSASAINPQFTAFAAPDLNVAAGGSYYGRFAAPSGELVGFALASGSPPLPPWLTLTSTGRLYGQVPSDASGSYPFTLAATDGSGVVVTQAETLTVVPATPVTFNTTSLAPGYLNQAYSATISTSIPTTAITGASVGQTLPQATLVVNSTAGFSPSGGTLLVSTSAGTQTVHYTGITTTAPFEFTGCTGGSGTLSAGGAVVGGIFRVSGGGLPLGLFLSSNGTLLGTPRLGGNYFFTVQASDDAGNTASMQYAMTVVSVATRTSSVAQNATILSIFGTGFDPDVSKDTITIQDTQSGTPFGGTVLSVNTAATAMVVRIPTGQLTSTGQLLATVTVDGTSLQAQQVGTVVANQHPSVTAQTTNLASNATVLKFAATGIDTAAGGTNLVALSYNSNGSNLFLVAPVITSTTISVLSNGAALPQTIINVASTAGFPTSGTILVTTSTGVQNVKYTGKTATTFTGCTGGGGTMSTGGRVQIPSLNTVVMSLPGGLTPGNLYAGLLTDDVGSIPQQVATIISPVAVTLNANLNQQTSNVASLVLTGSGFDTTAGGSNVVTLTIPNQTASQSITLGAVTVNSSNQLTVPVTLKGNSFSVNATVTVDGVVSTQQQVAFITGSTATTLFVSNPLPNLANTATTVEIYGSGFTSSSKVTLTDPQQKAIPTTFTTTLVSPNQLEITGLNMPAGISTLVAQVTGMSAAQAIANIVSPAPAAPTITGGSVANGTLTITGTGFDNNGFVSSLQVTTSAKYTTPPKITLTGGGGTGATAVAVLDKNGNLTGLSITNGGTGYTSAPTVMFSSGSASATAGITILGGYANNLVTLLDNGVPLPSGAIATTFNVPQTTNGLPNVSVNKTGTQLTVNLAGPLPAGSISAVVTSDGVASQPVVLFNNTSLNPTVTASSENLSASLVDLAITGTNFDPGPTGTNKVTLYSGGVALPADTVSQVMVNSSTQLTAILNQALLPAIKSGALSAVVTTDGLTSGTPTQVANIVVPGPTVVPGNLPATGATLTIDGANFDPTANNIALGTLIANSLTPFSNVPSSNGNTTLSVSPASFQNATQTAIQASQGGTLIAGATVTPLLPTNTTGGYPVASIAITNAGSGYTTAPTVTIGAPPAGGIQATAIATISAGVVTGINITNPGSGYTQPPAVTLSKPQQASGATATAVSALAIANSAVNSFPAGMTVTGPGITGTATVYRTQSGGAGPVGITGGSYQAQPSPVTTAVTKSGITLGKNVTINVGSTVGFPAMGTILVTTNKGIQVVSYTGTNITQTAFTGCTGGTGTVILGSTVSSTGTYQFSMTVPGLTLSSTGLLSGLASNAGFFVAGNNACGLLMVVSGPGIPSGTGVFAFTSALNGTNAVQLGASNKAAFTANSGTYTFTVKSLVNGVLMNGLAGTLGNIGALITNVTGSLGALEVGDYTIGTGTSGNGIAGVARVAAITPNPTNASNNDIFVIGLAGATTQFATQTNPAAYTFNYGGPVYGTVTTGTGDSAVTSATIQVANDAPNPPTITPNKVNLASNALAVVLSFQGSGFQPAGGPTPTVTLFQGGTPISLTQDSVTVVNDSFLYVTLNLSASLAEGELDAQVTVPGVGSSAVTQVATVVGAVNPVVTPADTTLSPSATTLSITGTGFDFSTGGHNLVRLTFGMAGQNPMYFLATPDPASQSLIVQFTPGISLPIGDVFADVTVDGISSGTPVKVATVSDSIMA